MKLALIFICVLVALTGTSAEHEFASFATFNTGLLYGSVPHAEERQPLILESAAEWEQDVLCVQELWRSADVKAVAQAAHHYPYQAAFIDIEQADNVTEPACTETETGSIYTCLITNCAAHSTDADALIACMLAMCYPVDQDIDCFYCLAQELNIQGPTDVFTYCATDTTYNYDPSMGLLLLSKTELTDVAVTQLEGVFRGIIQATTVIGGEEYAIGCTHFINQGAVDSVNISKSNFIQANTLMTATTPERKVLLGDLNTGPEFPLAQMPADLGETYPLIKAAGWDCFIEEESSTVAPVDRSKQCTWCPYNTELISSTNDYTLLDHVCAQGFHDYVAHRSRILDEFHQDGYFLSDHFGVEVKFYELELHSAASAFSPSLSLVLVFNFICMLVLKN